MVLREVLILGVPVIHSTISVAGMTAEPDPVTGLRWLRLVREPGAGYMVGGSGPVGLPLQSFDVVEVELLRPLPEPPYAENWLVRSGQGFMPLLRKSSASMRIFYPSTLAIPVVLSLLNLRDGFAVSNGTMSFRFMIRWSIA